MRIIGIDDALEEVEATREAATARPSPYEEVRPDLERWFGKRRECPHEGCQDWRSTEQGMKAHIAKMHHKRLPK